jgi:hypothetical protein
MPIKASSTIYRIFVTGDRPSRDVHRGQPESAFPTLKRMPNELNMGPKTQILDQRKSVDALRR